MISSSSSSCFSWIPFLREKLVDMFISRPQCEALPEDIIAEILSRLPAKCVFHECRTVCKQWNSLISTSSFNEMHLHRATPTVIFQQWSMPKKELRFVDEWGDMNNKNRKKKPRTKQICASDVLSANLKETVLLCFSYNGLLVFRTPLYTPKYAILPNDTIIIFSPITQEKIILYNHHKDKICGLFFHPIAREYRVLWLAFVEKRFVGFKMLSLGPQSYWRGGLFKFNASPRVYTPPVNLYGALHWMSAVSYDADNKKVYDQTCSQSIIIFSIVKEEFRLMPHPGDISKCSSTWQTHLKLHLLDLEGQLSVCRCSDILEIWVLEDYGSWFWTKRYSIKLELDFRRVKPIGMQNGALLLHMSSCIDQLLAYHLQEKTIKILVFEKLKCPLGHTTVCLHSNSPVSLKKFPAKIFMP